MIRLAALALIAGAAAAGAQERDWVIDAASDMTIIYEVDGIPQTGVFERFEGTARFDPGALETARLTLIIETDSFVAPEPFATQFVKSIDWLFVEEHPVARYEVLSLTRIGEDRFRAEGELTMRGRTNRVGGELTVSVNQDRARATGAARFDRTEFGVGVGFSTLFVEIGPEIEVAFDLTATPRD